jgi:putative membrane protein
VMLVLGVAVYTKVTPFHERELLQEGNIAAATVLSGAVVALAIPLAALLATTRAVLDIVVWGIVAILLQLVTVVIVSHLLRRMRLSIDDGNVAAALPIMAAQLAIALLNAAGMVPV